MSHENIKTFIFKVEAKKNLNFKYYPDSKGKRQTEIAYKIELYS